MYVRDNELGWPPWLFSLTGNYSMFMHSTLFNVLRGEMVPFSCKFSLVI